MELTLDSSPNNNFKHFCKICKKGFMCGRALGGHMRAHGIGVDDAADVYDDEDATSDWEAGAGNSAGGVGSSKRMYALRTNPNRTRSRACDNCGKEFLSWKSFLEHGRCCGGGGSEEEEEEEESPAASSPSSDNGDGWSKRKRTFRSEVESNFTVNDYNLANCLMMLSNAAVDPAAAAVVVDQPEESSASAERMPINFTAAPLAAWAPPPTKGLFECKACKKVFNSHQALGGHRASHKKVKGCFAARLDRVSNFFDEQTGANNNNINSPKRIKGTKVHECSICHRVFNSGQALGGHKRCHWITPASSSAAMAMDPTLARFQQLQHDGHVEAHVQQEERRVDQAGLDLNILPGQNEDSKNVLTLKVSSEFFLKYEESINKENMKNVVVGPPKTKNDTNENSFESLKANVDDEADSKMKMAKLSELKEMNVAGDSAPWLQVGIGSNNGGDL